MQLLSNSAHGRQFTLSGLPALILGVAIATIAGTFLIAVSFFGIVIWGARRILTSMLGLFGAADASPRVSMMNSGTGKRNTIEMRRDTRGSWRKE